MKVIMFGWEYGMNKLQLTKIQNNLLGISLKTAKENTMKVLDEIEVELEIDDDNVAKKFINKLSDIKVLFRVKF